jgi:hypothetical protein
MTVNQRTKTMTTFHPQQFDRGQYAYQKAGTSALQINVTNCTAKLRAQVHEARKIQCNNVSSMAQKHDCKYCFYAKQALPLSRAKVLQLANGSPVIARIPARRSRNVRDTTGKTSGEMSRVIVAPCPRNRRAAAGVLSPDGRRDDSQDNLRYADVGRAASALETCETTHNLFAQRRRNSRATVHATSRKQLAGFSPPAFNRHS